METINSAFSIGDLVARRAKTNRHGKVVEIAERGIRVLWEKSGSRKNVRTWIQAHALIKK